MFDPEPIYTAICAERDAATLAEYEPAAPSWRQTGWHVFWLVVGVLVAAGVSVAAIVGRVR